MDKRTIALSRETTFLGRNGTFKCTGFTFIKQNYNKIVNIYPITSKGEMARCRISMPQEDLLKFCKELTK